MNADVMKWLGMLLAGGAWFALVVLGKADVDTFVQFVQYLLVGVGAHAMTKAGAPPAAAPPPPAPTVIVKEGGYAGIVFLLLLVAIGLYLSLLAGCAGLNAQGVLTITYNTPTVSTTATLLPGAAPLPAGP